MNAYIPDAKNTTTEEEEKTMYGKSRNTRKEKKNTKEHKFAMLIAMQTAIV